MDVLLGRIGAFTIKEIARRTTPCYKRVVGRDGTEKLEVCLMVDTRYLYAYPFELRGLKSLTAKARYLTGDMEHLRLREFEPGICRYVNALDEAATAAR